MTISPTAQVGTITLGITFHPSPASLAKQASTLVAIQRAATAIGAQVVVHKSPTTATAVQQTATEPPTR